MLAGNAAPTWINTTSERSFDTRHAEKCPEDFHTDQATRILEAGAVSQLVIHPECVVEYHGTVLYTVKQTKLYTHIGTACLAEEKESR